MEAKTDLYGREEEELIMDNLGATELRLGLPGCTAPDDQERQKPARAGTNKRPLQTAELEIRWCSWRSRRSSSTTADSGSSSSASTAEESDQDCPEAAAPPSAKAQVVGWPPVRSYRKNKLYYCRGLIRAAAAEEEGEEEEEEAEEGGGGGVLYVKVSMDGAPYLRKMDLSVFRGYKELREALESMFMCSSIGFEARARGPATSHYAITYQDKDGDWMLAGDVPWEMFTSSCTRLRVMKGTEARGFGSP